MAANLEGVWVVTLEKQKLFKPVVHKIQLLKHMQECIMMRCLEENQHN